MAARTTPARAAAGSWRRIVRRYGWRAYALPILSAVTIATVVHGAPSPAVQPTAARQGGGNTAPQGGSAGSGGVQGGGVEGGGVAEAGYRQGSTPTPVVINLGNDAESCARNDYDQLVIVSLHAQHLWACEGHKQVNTTAVTTGRTTDNDQTPLGSWRVQSRERNRYLVGKDYRDYVKYWVPFNGDFGFHDASWQTMKFGSPDYRTRGSHGCVHLPTPEMDWLYHWSNVADTVVTIEK